MGHVHSKKKRRKKIHDISGSSGSIPQSLLVGKMDTLSLPRSVKDMNRYSVDSLDRVSFSSAYSTSPDSGLGSDPSYGMEPRCTLSLSDPSYGMEPRCTLSLSRNNNISKDVRTVKEAFSCEKISVEDHPVMTKLQNEQNRRLEKMEARMEQIRTHAMQEAERRKFARMFRVKTESPTRDLLCKAKHKLDTDLVTVNKKPLISEKNLLEDSDKGEIIPVTSLPTVPKPAECQPEEKVKSETRMQQYLKNVPALGAVNSNDPKSILLLPFLLPVFMFWLLVRMVARTETWQRFTTVPSGRHNKKD